MKKHRQYTESSISPRPKKARVMKSKVKRMLIISSGINGKEW
jgi:hypothetical protein